MHLVKVVMDVVILSTINAHSDVFIFILINFSGPQVGFTLKLKLTLLPVALVDSMVIFTSMVLLKPLVRLKWDGVIVTLLAFELLVQIKLIVFSTVQVLVTLY